MERLANWRLSCLAGDAPAAGGEQRAMERMRRGPYGKTAARRVEILDAALAVFGRSG
jgi:hypothetical protein